VTLPASFAPYVTSPRRYHFLRERERRRTAETGPADAFRGQRLAATGTALPVGFPSRTVLLAAGVLAVEEVVGAGVDELRSYGLSLPRAEALIRFLEGFTMTTFNYGPRAGQLYEEDEVELLASGTRTASGTSDVYELGDRSTLRLDLDVTAVSGSGTVHVQIETRKAYASGAWRVVDAFGLASAVGAERRTMGGCDRFVRAVYTIGGTSVTFSLAGEAV
jgi:hypothetical protein